MELFRVFLYAAQEYNILKFAEICVAILDDRLSGFFFFFFGVFTVKVIFMKWSQIFLRYLELFRDVMKKISKHFEKNREFPEHIKPIFRDICI